MRWSGILISLRIFYSLLWSPQSKASLFFFFFHCQPGSFRVTWTLHSDHCCQGWLRPLWVQVTSSSLYSPKCEVEIRMWGLSPAITALPNPRHSIHEWRTLLLSSGFSRTSAFLSYAASFLWTFLPVAFSETSVGSVCNWAWSCSGFLHSFIVLAPDKVQTNQ